MFMFSFIFVIVCGPLEWKRIYAGFLLFVYFCIAVEDTVIKMGGNLVEIRIPMKFSVSFYILDFFRILTSTRLDGRVRIP